MSNAASGGGTGAGAGAGEPSVTASDIVAQAVGSHILRIDGYSHTKALGNGKCIASGKFTVGGHRWRLNYYPDGDASKYSGYISVYLSLDHTNVDVVKARFTISLLDKEGNPVPSYSRSASNTFSLRHGGNASWGFGELIRRSDLEGSVYLKDDVFSVRCDLTVAAKEIIAKDIPVPVVRRGV